MHARGGHRAQYEPVGEAAGVVIDGDPIALARAYVDVLGVRELYVADLDAIEQGPKAMQSAHIAGIAAPGVPLWVDAGTSTVADAKRVRQTGASIVVVGLETLQRLDALREICADIGGDRVALSLDVRNGMPIVPPNVGHATATAVEIAATSTATGVRTMVLLDIARVGTGAGIDAELVAEIRTAAPEVALFAGGGVRDASDLATLARVGCDGALIATALLTGAVKV